MSPLTALFEALHSAWIDELTELHPEPKPVLSLPQRFPDIRAPAQGLSDAIVIEVEVGDKKGVLLLAQDPGGARSLGKDAEGVWSAMKSRAASEFSRRDIRPKFMPIEKWNAEAPSRYVASRVVWVGVELAHGRSYFALAA